MTNPVVICACTFRRPDGLRDLFRSYEAMVVPPNADLSIVVVDNDETPSSEPLVTELADKLDWPVRYVHEPEPGIPSARNRAITEAGSQGHMVFVDDDETVDPDWLQELMLVATETGATFVQGPVVMQVEDPKDQWFLDSALFKQKTFPDRAPRSESWTNNVAIDLEFLTRTGCRFDPALRFDGGSDTLFFQDIIRAGGNGVFAARANVFEIQPKSRLTWGWALNRQYRYGMTRANTVMLRTSRLKAIGYCLVRGIAMLAVGTAYGLTGIFRGKRGFGDGAALLARGCGVLMGALGGRKLEYAR